MKNDKEIVTKYQQKIFLSENIARLHNLGDSNALKTYVLYVQDGFKQAQGSIQPFAELFENQQKIFVSSFLTQINGQTK